MNKSEDYLPGAKGKETNDFQISTIPFVLLDC